MSLNLVKLSVGTQSIEDLGGWQNDRLAQMRAAGEKRPRLFHRTFQRPKREAELCDGGSIYWVIKGVIQARQRIVGFDDGARPDGRPCCLVLLDKTLVAVRPSPRRAFQGWRYLTGDDAPHDLAGNEGSAITAMPASMRRELIELCLI